MKEKLRPIWMQTIKERKINMCHVSAFIGVLSAIVLLVFSACGKKADNSPTTEATAPLACSVANKESAHACLGALPGSNDDWCGEHAVPESLCTRCNPSLIAAFKATGDWCEEHGLPESQCLICNPDLKIERPPRAAEASP